MLTEKAIAKIILILAMAIVNSGKKGGASRQEKSHDTPRTTSG